MTIRNKFLKEQKKLDENVKSDKRNENPEDGKVVQLVIVTFTHFDSKE